LGAFLLVFDDDHLHDLPRPDSEKIIQVGGIRGLALVIVAVGKCGNEIVAVMFDHLVYLERYPVADHFLLAPFFDRIRPPEVPGEIVYQSVFGKTGDKGAPIMVVGCLYKVFMIAGKSIFWDMVYSF
jgi:hypothetical protein